MASIFVDLPITSSGIPIYANVAAFPSTGNVVGAQAVDASNIGNIYEWNGSSWILTASSGGVSGGDLTADATAGLSITNGTGAVIGSGSVVNQHVADSTHSGYLSAADWGTFNSAAGGGITGGMRI